MTGAGRSDSAVLQATGRLRKNAHYFKVNYLVVIVTITAVTMALYPTSLIVLGLLAVAWLYMFVMRQKPLVIGGRTFKYVACIVAKWVAAPTG